MNHFCDKVSFGRILILFVLLCCFVAGNAMAEEPVMFYDAKTNNGVAELGVAQQIVSKINLEGDYSGDVLVTAVCYGMDGTLLSVGNCDTVTMTAGESFQYTTPAFSVVDATEVKVFCWRKDNLFPILLTPGILSKPIPKEKFDVVFPNTDSYLYRVGNQNSIALGKLFCAVEDADIGTVFLSCEAIDETGVQMTFSQNTSDWTKGTVSFSGTGVVKLSITDNLDCVPTVLLLEVVDAFNATSAVNATANHVVLLNDAGFSTLTVSGGYTFYGNGFTLKCTSDSVAIDRSYSFVSLENGTLDNVKIIVPNYSHAILYEANKLEEGNSSITDSNGRTRYYNIKSAVITSGNCKILNSYISGGRAAVYAPAGDVLIENSTIFGGAAANIHLGAAESLTLRDTTLVQMPIPATVNDTSKTIMGMSVLAICDENGDAAPVVLEGNLVQYAWANADYKQYAPSAAEMLLDRALSMTNYVHKIKDPFGEEKDSVNLGIVYLPDATSANHPDITDARTNKESVPYDVCDMTAFGITARVYTYRNTNGTDEKFQTVPDYQSEINGPTFATVEFSASDDGKVLTESYDVSSDSKKYQLTVDLNNGEYQFDFSDLLVKKYGKSLNYTVSADGEPFDISVPYAVTDGKKEFLLHITDDVYYDKNGVPIQHTKQYTYLFDLVGVQNGKDAPVVTASQYEDALCVASSAGGTWHGAAPVLEGIQIRYWSVSEGSYKTVSLADFTPETPGKQNGTSNYWSYSPENGDFTLTITNPTPVHSSNQVYAMPVVAGGKLYFVPSNSNGLVNSGNSARSIKISYTFEDNNTGTSSFTHTWSVPEDLENEYKYSDFCIGALNKMQPSSREEPCFTPDTLITLSDGSKKQIQHLTYDDKVLVWDFYHGEYQTKNIALLVNHSVENRQVISMEFSDDTILKLVGYHGVFDYDLNCFVYPDANTAKDYIGHRFVKESAEGYRLVTLKDVIVTKEMTDAYSITSANAFNAFAEGVLTIAPPDAFYNWMPMGDTLRYDTKKLHHDTVLYGLYTYDDFKNYVTLRQFYDFNGKYLKIPVEKGVFTFEDILELISLYREFMPD